jgi:hypothetical protein
LAVDWRIFAHCIRGGGLQPPGSEFEALTGFARQPGRPG